ncbi:MAG: two-component system sensor histidine kinase QseC [Enterobacterales bacterium]|jgi:two-component system sensor histidine kinase QseC
MKSIRIFLIISLIAIITLVNFISSVNGYDKSMAEANKSFDQHLVRYANILRAIPWKSIDKEQIKNSEKIINELMHKEPNSVIAFNIFDTETLQSISSTVSEYNIEQSLSPGFQFINFGGYRWNALVVHDPRENIAILVAERNDLRFTMTENIVLASIVPIIAVIPIVAILIWLVVGFGLAPITQFADNFKTKEATDLSPIQLGDVPKELTVLASSANDLLKRLEQSFEREKRFSSDAAHELRTPITALKLHIDNLLAETPYPSQSTALLKVSIDRIGHLVEQILALNRTSPDQYLSNFTEFNLLEVAQNIIIQQYPELSEKNINIVLNGESCPIIADKFGIETLLSNVLSNAIKYCNNNCDIEVSLIQTIKTISIIIIDSGPGIAAELRDRVFERFYRVDGDRHKSSVQGCGLGLSIVKHIVTMHNGSINLADSAEEPGFDSGLKVTIVLPNLVHTG